jgi:hypothetical protein
MEDLLMVEKFKTENKNTDITFYGIYGKDSVIESNELKEIFISKRADILMENVNQIPNILNNTKKILL